MEMFSTLLVDHFEPVLHVANLAPQARPGLTPRDTYFLGLISFSLFTLVTSYKFIRAVRGNNLNMMIYCIYLIVRGTIVQTVVELMS